MNQRYRLLINATIIVGASLAVVLGVISLVLFPGGNHFDPQQLGYSWTGNWLCDSFRPWSHGGMDNRVGSGFAGVAMIVFAWLSVFPGFAFTLNSAVKNRVYQWLIFMLAFLTATGMTLLTLSMMWEWTYRHDFFVWIAVGPSLLMGFVYGAAGWSQRLFPNWFILTLIAVAAVFLADIAIWQHRVWLDYPPTFWEPFLMKIATVLVGLTIIGLSRVPAPMEHSRLEA